MINKICTKCNIKKSLTEFYKGKSYKGGKCTFCKKCCNESLKIWRHTEKGKLSLRKQTMKVRKDMIVAYGGCCVDCGESDPVVLTIDHIDGTGNEHRKIVGAGLQLYKWLKKHNYPKDNYELVCRNCNWRRWAIQSGSYTLQNSKEFNLRGLR